MKLIYLESLVLFSLSRGINDALILGNNAVTRESQAAFWETLKNN